MHNPHNQAKTYGQAFDPVGGQKDKSSEASPAPSNLTTATTNALNHLTETQDMVRAAHAAAQTGSLCLATVRRDLVCRLGRIILDLAPARVELEALITAARILDGLEREEQARLESVTRQNRPRPP